MDGSQAFARRVYSGVPSINMGGVGGCAPCAAAAMGAESVIDETPPPEAPWVVRHWALVLLGTGVLAAGLIWAGTYGE